MLTRLSLTIPAFLRGDRQTGPDFICVGQQKAGTTWLYDQLATHPDFWMPPLKELHYFDDELGPQTWKGRRSERPHQDGSSQKYRPDRRDRRFHAAAFEAKDTKFDFERYRALFAMRGRLISGDITPGYSILAAPDIKRVADSLPHTQVLLLVRDPVQRFWSMLRMMVGQDKVKAAVGQNWDRLQVMLSRDGVRTRSFATRLWTDWRAAAGEERVSLFFFDDLVADAASFRAGIITQLGGDPARPSGVPLDYNSHSFDVQLELRDDIRAQLVQHFSEELMRGAEMFGGHAKEWPKRYGL